MLGITKHDPTRELATFSDRLLNGFFDDLFEQLRTTASTVTLPSVDIYSEGDKTMVVRLQAPGYEQDDIDIKVANGVLEVHGKRAKKEESDGRAYMVREMTNEFVRRIVLPDGANADGISAELDKGILSIVVPVEQPEVKRIEIGASRASDRTKLAAGDKSK